MRVDRDSLIRAVLGEGRTDVDLSGATVKSGWESVVLDSGDGWIYRFPRQHVDFERELAILWRLRGRLPAPIPVVEWTGQHTTFAAYRKLEGDAFDPGVYEGTDAAEWDVLAASLASFLVAMHTAFTTVEIAELGIPGPEDPFQQLVSIRSRLAEMPASLRRGVVDILDEAEPTAGHPGDDLVVTHNDFDFSNMVLDGPIGRLTGVWDFSCVQLGSRSADLRYLAGRSVDLAARAGSHYETLCGKPIDVSAAVLADRIERIGDSLDAGADDLERIISDWIM